MVTLGSIEFSRLQSILAGVLYTLENMFFYSLYIRPCTFTRPIVGLLSGLMRDLGEGVGLRFTV